MRPAAAAHAPSAAPLTRRLGRFGHTGPTFSRTVIPGMAAGAERVELWPPTLRLARIATPGAPLASLPEATQSVSVATPLDTFKSLVRSALQLSGIADPDIRFFRLPGSAAAAPAPLDPASLPLLQPELIDEQMAAAASAHPTLEMLQVEGRALTLAVDVRSHGRWGYDESAPPASEQASAPVGVKGVFSANTEDHWSKIQASSQMGKQPDAPAPNGTADLSASSGWSVVPSRASSAAAKPQAKQSPSGLVGLQNLGNTCFMNSALQCLSNTPEVQEYFVSNVFREEINRDNPLGNGGALAEAFGALLQRLWASKGSAGTVKSGVLSRYGGWPHAISPREFKFAVSRFAPQFAGYGQQDTQELLAFLLDGLHEDLNRIQKKPYIESPDWEGGDDRALVEFARKQWDLYKARNDSLIVDLFQGQYKSTLVCPECQKVAIKFDPFMYLTLPMPNRRQWTGSIFFVPYDPTRKPTKLTLSLPQDATMAQLRARVGDAFGVHKDHLLAGEVWQRNIQKWYLDWDSVSEIGSSDVAYCWELPVPVRLPATKQSAFSFIRAGSQPASDYERLAPPNAHPAASDWAILPVFTMLALVGGSASSRPLRPRKGNALPMGIPFFAAIPPEHKNDPEAVAQIVEWQYTRYAQSPEDFKTIIRGADTISSSASATSAAASDAGTPAASMDVMPDGVNVALDADDDSKSVTMGEADALPEASSAETAPPPPSTSAAYTMYYLSRRFTSPLPQSGQNYDDGGERISARAERRKQGSDWPSFEKKDEQGDSVQQAWPLVYTSGAAVCVWTTAAAKAAFIRGEREVWGPYEERVDPSASASKVHGARKSDLTLWDCLDEFTRSEQLGADDLWHCPHCKDFRQATKKFDLWKVPDILVVHLKRFSAARYSRDKIDDFVDFPITGLDLSDYVLGPKVIKKLEEEGNNPISVTPTAAPPDESYATPPPSELGSTWSDRPPSRVAPDSNDDAVASDYPIYDLYAVDNHFGGLGGGHYTAAARNREDGQWYYYDDSSVRPIKPEEAKTRAAYLLFYRRRTTRPIGGKTRQRLDESIGSLAASSEGLPLAPAPVSMVHGRSQLAAATNGLPEADAAYDPYATSSSSDSASSDEELLGQRLGHRATTVRVRSSSQSEVDEPAPRPPRRTKVSTVPVTDDEAGEDTKPAPALINATATNDEQGAATSARDQLFSTPTPSFYTRG